MNAKESENVIENGKESAEGSKMTRKIQDTSKMTDVGERAEVGAEARMAKEKTRNITTKGHPHHPLQKRDIIRGRTGTDTSKTEKEVTIRVSSIEMINLLPQLSCSNHNKT